MLDSAETNTTEKASKQTEAYFFYRAHYRDLYAGLEEFQYWGQITR